MQPVFFVSSGAFIKTESRLKIMLSGQITKALEKYGAQGVAVLKAATPVETSATANAWTYQIKRGKGLWQLGWYNSNKAGDTPLAILIQYGHGTGTGGYVAGEDYINPAIKPIFDQIVAEIRREVTRR